MVDESGKLVLKDGSPVDRGGHLNDQTAQRQAQHINDWYAAQRGIGAKKR